MVELVNGKKSLDLTDVDHQYSQFGWYGLLLTGVGGAVLMIALTCFV